MPDLIDRATLLTALRANLAAAITRHDGGDYEDEIRYAIRAVEGAEGVDAVEVVRCRECKHAEPIPDARRGDYFDPDILRHCTNLRTEADAYGICAIWDDCYCDEGVRKEAEGQKDG